MKAMLLLTLVTFLAFTPRLLAADPPTTQPADVLTAKSVWTGVEDNDDRKAHRIERHCSFKIIDRDGDKFTAEFREHIDGQPRHATRGLKLEGKIQGDQIAMKATNVLPGGDWKPGILDIIWKGQVKGDQLKFARTYDTDLTTTISLTLDNSGKDDLDGDSEKPKKKK